MTATLNDLQIEQIRAADEAGFNRHIARIKSEPATYRPDTTDSFFADLARTQLRPSDPETWQANQRLQRHAQEQRVNPNSTAATGGEFSPPLWAIDQFAVPARAGRVIADLVPNLVLPSGVDSVHVPILTTGGSTAVQGADGTPASNTDQVTGDVPNKSVVTVTGDIDASQQLLDRVPPPGYDAIAYTDLNRAYNATLEQQLTYGTGANGQLTGVTVVTGRQTDVSGSGTSTTQATGVASLKPLIGQAMAAIGNNRKLPADNLILAPRRWAWIVSDVSEIPQTQGWPLPGFPAVGADQKVLVPAMAFAGLPTYQSAAAMSGAITASDVAILIRSTDMLLYESTPKFLVAENPLSGTLGVRLQLRRYVAFPILRPAGICVVTALPAPTAFGA